jgi:2-dehydropantoate 2-reductase
MRILIIGAGVLGTFYGARLSASGHDVTIFARQLRAQQVRLDGLVVEQRRHGSLRARVKVIESLGRDDAYDYVIVLVRNEQVDSVLPMLAANVATPNIAFMFNNAAGPQLLIGALGQDRVMLGFPGAGGERDSDGAVHAAIVTPIIQKTTVGELDGRLTPRVRRLARVLKMAGFPTAISRSMDAWLKTHVALVSPIAEAFYAAGGQMKSLSANKPLVLDMVRNIRHAFAALRALGIPITPSRLRGIEWVPEWMLVGLCRLAFRSEYAELIIARHANSARTEMAILSGQLRTLVGNSPSSRGVTTSG